MQASKVKITKIFGGRIVVATEGKAYKRRRDSDGKLVNVGNFDSDGANVNSNTPDNSNDNLGVSFSRSLPLALLGGGFFFFKFLFIRRKAFYPSAKHPPYFFQRLLQYEISPLVNCLDIVADTDKCLQYLKLHVYIKQKRSLL